jgi:predicted O-methyltransferase YrrM
MTMTTLTPPPALAQIQADTVALGFPMASEPEVGALLRTLAASKPGGVVLELGTGTGLATTWLLDGMDAAAHLITVDNDPAVAAIARRHLASDSRVQFHVMDAADLLPTLAGESVDLLFADTWAGKYTQFDAALRLLKPGGLYVIDDMLPQPNWPAGHAVKVAHLLADLSARADLVVAQLAWASGVVVATKRS